MVDIKSQHSYAFHYMQKEGYDINKEKYTNILQVMTYAWILKKPKGILYFISKDDLCSEEYTFFTEKWLQKIQAELDMLRDYWDKDELPPPKARVFGVNKKTKEPNECAKYCNFKTLCIGEKCGYKPSSK